MASITFGSSLTLLRSDCNDAVVSRPFRSAKFLSLNQKLKSFYYSSKMASLGVGVSRASGTEVLEDRTVEKEERGRVLKVGLVCGGPSAERGISLNSARSVLDHIKVVCFTLFFKGNYNVIKLPIINSSSFDLKREMICM